MKISPAKINSLLWIEKAAILPVVLAASKRFFFRGECVAFTTGDTCECSSIKKKTQRCTLNIFHCFTIYHLNRRNKCRSYVKNANICLEVRGVHVLLELYANVYAS